MKKTKGITLIALIITIIVLLILEGVAIAVLRGDNGIITKATKSKTASEEATDKEEIKLSYQKATMDEVMGAAISEFKDNFEDELKTYDESATVVEKNEKYKVTINGRIYEVDKEINIIKVTSEGETQTAISTTNSYVGYYADINDDGTVDGIIYADLLNPVSSQWYDYRGEYSYPNLYTGEITSAKKYCISTKTYTGQTEAGKYKANDGLGTKNVIVPMSETNGNDRFYVMALSDCSIMDWTSVCGAANETNSREFGAGKTNCTINYLYKETNNQWTWEQKTDGTGTWFVPSSGEWSAFAQNLGISSREDNDKYYGKIGLSKWYWASTLTYPGAAELASFRDGYVLRQQRYRWWRLREI